MILATLLILQMPATTLGEALRLPPAAAGDLLLAGQEHRLIESVAPSSGPALPATEEVSLIERAVVVAGGCTRRHWTANFHRRPSGTRDTATLTTAYSVVEVALLRSGACDAATPFVHVNPGLEPVDAMQGLLQLDRIVSARGTASIACSDAIQSGFCEGGTGAVRRKLRTLAPWAVSRQGADLVFWLGTPGETITDVRFARESPHRVIVDRRIPAPF